MLKIELTEEQTQRALVVLGQAPYIEIADVIDAIKHQANEQIFQDVKDDEEEVS